MFFAAVFGALLRGVDRFDAFAFTVLVRALRRFVAGVAKVAVLFCFAVVRRRLTRRLLAGDFAALGLLRAVLLRAVEVRAVEVRRLLGLLRAVLLRAPVRAVLRFAGLFFALGAVFFALVAVLRGLVVRFAVLRAVLFRDEVRDFGACFRAVVERFAVRRRLAAPVFVFLFVFTGMKRFLLTCGRHPCTRFPAHQARPATARCAAAPQAGTDNTCQPNRHTTTPH